MTTIFVSAWLLVPTTLGSLGTCVYVSFSVNKLEISTNNQLVNNKYTSTTAATNPSITAISGLV